jgi:TPR repeat protein
MSLDFRKAVDPPFRLCLEESRKGNADAQAWLGYYYKYGGQRVKRSPKKSTYWFRKSARQGQPYSCFQLGILARDAAQLSRAEQLFEKSAQNGYILAANEIGRIAEGRQNFHGAFRYYKDGATHGDPIAMFNLGRCYLHGIGTAQKMQAQVWLKRSLRSLRGITGAKAIITSAKRLYALSRARHYMPKRPSRKITSSQSKRIRCRSILTHLPSSRHAPAHATQTAR